MWELIRANRRKSIILFVCMGLCLLILGFVIGSAVAPDGGVFGILIAFAIWLLMSAVSYFAGASILLAVSGAKPVTADIHPQLFNVVEEMKIAANLPVMPKVYIIPDAAPNAFAAGIKPQNSVIVVTAGLLSLLDRDELQGVVAHEMSHIVNRDVLFMTFAGILLGSIVLISQVFLRGVLYSGGSSRRYRSSSSRGGGGGGGGQAQVVIMIIAVVLAILAPIIARLLYFAISRRREYLADASAVRLTRYPDGLAGALEAISSSDLKLSGANKVTAPMYISNPFAVGKARLSALSSTHPPIGRRIAILRSISQGAGLGDYQRAYSKVSGAAGAVIPPSALREADSVPIRKASAGKRPHLSKKRANRNTGDLIRAIEQYAFLACACGLKIKVPPDFKKPSIRCPRCNRAHHVPIAELAAAGAVLAGGGLKPEPKQEPRQKYTYHRTGSGWESFRCGCGSLQQLSPAFSGDHIECHKCGRTTEIA